MTLIKLTTIENFTVLIDIRRIVSITDNGEFRVVWLDTNSLYSVYKVKETIEEIESIQKDIRSLRCFHFSLLG